MIYDTAVIGTGPAGLSAALNLKIHNKNIVWIGSSDMSDKISKAELVRNYPGLPEIKGGELAKAFKKHADEMELEITEGVVNSIMFYGGSYALMVGSDYYQAKTIIFATGVATSKTIPGESELIGKGVSYCATCDGGLYRGKTVAVILGSERFVHEVEYLAELCAKVYCVPMYKDCKLSGENIEIVSDRTVKVLSENDRVSGLELKSGDVIKADGIFCLRDSVAMSTLLPDLKTNAGLIEVARDMSTNLPGVYAAGDCTGAPFQYAKSVGEGNVAAHSIIKYLSNSENE